MCAMICAQACRGGSTQLVSSRVTLPALSSTVKLDRPSRDFFTVSTIRGCKQRHPTLLTRKLASSLQRQPWVYDSADPSVRSMGKLLSSIWQVIQKYLHELPADEDIVRAVDTPRHTQDPLHEAWNRGSCLPIRHLWCCASCVPIHTILDDTGETHSETCERSLSPCSTGFATGKHHTHLARLHTRNSFSCVWLKTQVFVLQHFCARHLKKCPHRSHAMFRTILDPPFTAPSHIASTSSSLLFPSNWTSTETPLFGADLLNNPFSSQVVSPTLRLK